MKLRILVCLALFSLGAAADDFADSTDQGHAFAAEQNGYVQGLAGGNDARASSYGGAGQVTEQTHPCNQTNEQGQKTCGGETANPADDPSQYYGMSRTQLEDAARVKASTDEKAKWVMAGHDSRPGYDIRPEDPLFKNEGGNQQEMVDLTSSYSGCKTIKYGAGGDGGNETCVKTKKQTLIDIHCKREWTGACNWVSAHKFEVYKQNCTTVNNCTYSQVATTKKQETIEYINTGNGTMGTASSSIPYLHHDVPSSGVGNLKWVVKLSSLTSKTALFVQYKRWVADVDNKVAVRPTLKINGVDVPRVVTHWGIAKKTYRFVGAFANIKNYLREGENIVVLNVNGGTMEINKVANMQDVMECDKKYSNTYTCDSGGTAGAEYIGMTCLDNADRIIDGVTFQKSCWTEDHLYRKPGPPEATFTEEAKCDELRAKGCGTMGNTCTQYHADGWCQVSTLNFTCSTGEKTMQVCGESLVCADGACYDPYKQTAPDNKKDFMTAASYLAAMEDMKKQFDPNNVTVWKGEFQACKVKDSAVGGDRCCTGGTGFLADMGGGCDANEMKIAQGKQDQRVTFIRSRTVCEQRIAGSCVLEVTYMDFCIWPSKLARIVQDQGRPMLGQTVDNPCPGFKLQNPNEFQGINWDAIDLSDYFSDVQTKYNNTQKPDGQQLKSQQQQSNEATQNEYAEKYRQYYGD